MPLRDFYELRLQEAAVFFHIFFSVLAPIPFMFFMLFTRFWLLVPLYILWTCWDGNTPSRGGHPSEAFKNFRFWHCFAKYFPAQLHKTKDLPPDRNYIFGVHPHGIIGLSSVITFGTNATHFDELFPGIQRSTITLPVLFHVPFTREWALAAGGISSNEKSIDYVLRGDDGRGKCGRAVAIIIGGAEEALDSHPDYFEVELKERHGFIRLALRHGASLVPVYHFGETDLYYQIGNKRGTLLRKLQTMFKKAFTFSPPLFYGKSFNNWPGIMPYRRPLNTVVGPPIQVERCENPTKEQIDDLHSRYCEALRELFDDYKFKFGIDKKTTIKIS